MTRAAMVLFLASCAHSSTTTPTSTANGYDPDPALQYGTAPEVRRCQALADELDCPVGAELAVSIGPISEEGSAFCFASCEKDGVDHGPFLVHDLESGRYQRRGTRFDKVPHGVETARVRSGRDVQWVTISERTYKLGLSDGRWRRWHTSGQLASDGHYMQGAKHGEWTHWSRSGVVLSHGFFDRGQPVGLHIERYPNGQLKNRSPFDEEGRPHGEFCYWQSDGTEIDCFAMEFGTGTMKHYDSSGALLSTVEMHDGEPHGESIDYGFGGDRVVERYRHGARHGAQQVFAGECIVEEEHFREDVPHGPRFRQNCDVDPPIRTLDGQHCDGEPCGTWTERDASTGAVTLVSEFAADGTLLVQTAHDSEKLPERYEYPTPAD